MTIYYKELTAKGINFYEVEHSRRHIFWKEHPGAVEVSKKEFDFAMNLTYEKSKKPVNPPTDNAEKMD